MLRDHLKTIGLDASVDFLMDLYLVLQAWDDFYDGDEMPRAEKLQAIWASLVGIPGNPFYAQNIAVLLPLVSSLVLKWSAANTLEEKSERLRIAYVWRAGYFDVVLQCLMLEKGAAFALEHGHIVTALYGEEFEDYAKEFQHA